MERSGGEGRKKWSKDDLSRTSYEIHDIHRPKVLYLKEIPSERHLCLNLRR